MRTRYLAPLTATLLIAIFSIQKSATGQSTSEKPADRALTCRADAAWTLAHLHGRWLLEWTAPSSTGHRTTPASESLRLGPNPEFADSLVGELQRGSHRVQLAGDLEDGELTVEESADGKTISASWTATVSGNPCQPEIQGLWTRDPAAPAVAGQADQRRFRLRRLVTSW